MFGQSCRPELSSGTCRPQWDFEAETFEIVLRLLAIDLQVDIGGFRILDCRER